MRVGGFNPSRGIAIIQTGLAIRGCCARDRFQSLTRDSNHSNQWVAPPAGGLAVSFNPSRGIAIIQTVDAALSRLSDPSFNPSRGIAIIQTLQAGQHQHPRQQFQSLTRDSNHSNH